MKLLEKSFYAYHIIARRRHTLAKYLSDEQRHGAINEEMFRRLGYLNDQLYEVVFESEVEQKELTIVGLFILQYAKLRKLELYCNFFDKICVVTKI